MVTRGAGRRRAGFDHSAREWPVTRHRHLTPGFITVVIPTRNEKPNIAPLVRRITDELRDLVGEILFVDDSSDGTPAAIAAAAPRASIPVRLLHRPPENRAGGLSTAVVAGIRAAAHDWVVVMDADLQHPPETIRHMFDRAASTDVDLVVASRYSAGGRADGLAGFLRRAASRGLTTLARSAFPRRAGRVKDPMTGFFLVDRRAVPLDSLRPHGFKILLEILVRAPALRILEVGFDFGIRHAGESKASAREAARFLRHLARLRASAPRAPRAYYYDIHGLVRLQSEALLPELERLRVRRPVGPPDVNVAIGRPIRRRSTSQGLVYREIFRSLGFVVEIDREQSRTNIRASRLLGWSPHVLYTNVVEPVLRWTLAELGYALVHGACIAIDGAAYLVTARTDTGKTTTTLHLLEALHRSGIEFLGDDLVLVNAAGDVLAFPKPLTISAHTVQAVKRHNLRRRERWALPLQSRIHSRSGRKLALAMTRLPLPMATINAVAQIVVPPPKYRVGRLVNGVRIGAAARLSGMFVIVAEGHGKRMLDPDEAGDVLAANTEDAFGFPPYAKIEAFLGRGRDGEPLADREDVIRRAALAGCTAVELRDPERCWAPDIARLVLADRRAERARRRRELGNPTGQP